MKFSVHAILLLVGLGILDHTVLAAAKKPPRAPPSGRRSSNRTDPPRSSGRSSPSKRRYEPEDEEDDEDDIVFPAPFEDEEDFDEEEEDHRPKKKRVPSPKRGTPKRASAASGGRSSRSSRQEEDVEDDFDRPRRLSGSTTKPSRRGAPPPRRGNGGRVVPYGRDPGPSTFTKGLAALKNSIPDPSSVREAAVNSLNVAREATSGLSANLYREVKGLTSSELEQVMLKATRPDDTAVKGKHVERLVGVTYQISARYDIYDAVLRKLWAKMSEKDWRTTIKALYILHRFSADGAPEHAAALKARLRELRRTRDPKRKEKYFNSKQLLQGDNKPESTKFRAFMSRYAHYVLLRTQCFGGMFEEISSVPAPSKDKKKTVLKPITSTALRAEHLDAAKMLLKAGMACQLKDGEECENTAIAVERVASDLIGLTAGVAMALNRALKDDDLKGADPALIKQWCEFYGEELSPQTRSMVKRTTPKLDAYGLFLPSRMGATVSQDLLQKGLKLEEGGPDLKETSKESAEGAEDSKPEAATEEDEDAAVGDEGGEELKEHDESPLEVGEDIVEEDEYEYEEEEYYDDEEAY